MGFDILVAVLEFMFPESSLNMAFFKPITYQALICDVLLPEATVYLIQEDLPVSRHKAETTLDASKEFGRVYHSSDDNPALDDFISMMTQVIRKAEEQYLLWVAADTSLGFDEWKREQESQFVVKQELNIDDKAKRNVLQVVERKENGCIVLEILDD
jgi:hypothetical protein